jgi:hypothetical protein
MKRLIMLATVCLALTSISWAQAGSDPQQASPAARPSPTQNPTNPETPSTQMPPDKPAPPPQQQADPQQPELTQREPVGPYPGGQIQTGTQLQATLDTPLSSKTAHAGDQFTATVSQPVQDLNGLIAIPVGTKIRGEVAQVEQGKALPSVRGGGKLNLRFIDLTLPSGTSEPLAASLVSVHETSGGSAKTGQEGEVSGATSGKRAARDIGIGAGVGTVAGLLFGHTIRGLAIGAAAGGGYVLATQGKNVDLPAETGLVVRLDQTLTLPEAPGQR